MTTDKSSGVYYGKYGKSFFLHDRELLFNWMIKKIETCIIKIPTSFFTNVLKCLIFNYLFEMRCNFDWVDSVLVTG